MEKLYAGKHIIYDGISTSKKLKEIQPIYDFIELLSTDIGMTLVYPPLVARFPFASGELSRLIEKLENENINSKVVEEYKEVLHRRSTLDSGISGIGIQLESHISIHTQPEKNFFSLDVYSCKNFDHIFAIKLINEYFEVKNKSIIVLNRQINSPTEIILQYNDIK